MINLTTTKLVLFSPVLGILKRRDTSGGVAELISEFGNAEKVGLQSLHCQTSFTTPPSLPLSPLPSNKNLSLDMPLKQSKSKQFFPAVIMFIWESCEVR